MRAQLRRRARAIQTLCSLQVGQRLRVQAQRAAGPVGRVVGSDGGLLRRVGTHCGEQALSGIERSCGFAGRQLPVGQRGLHTPGMGPQAARLGQGQCALQQRQRLVAVAQQQQDLAQVARHRDLVGRVWNGLQQAPRPFTVAAAVVQGGLQFRLRTGVAQPVGHAHADGADTVGGDHQRAAGAVQVVALQRLAQQAHRLPGIAHAFQAHGQGVGGGQCGFGIVAAIGVVLVFTALSGELVGGIQRTVKCAALAAAERHAAQQFAAQGLEFRRGQQWQHPPRLSQQLGMTPLPVQLRAQAGTGSGLVRRASGLRNAAGGLQFNGGRIHPGDLAFVGGSPGCISTPARAS